MSSSRVVVFIDNSNVYKFLSELRKIEEKWVCLYDPRKLALKLAGHRQLAGTYFFCTPPPAVLLKTPEGERRHAVQTQYFNAVQKLPGVEVRFGTFQGVDGGLKEKNLDTQLTATMVTLAAQNVFDTAILVSNDADYISAIEPTKHVFKKKIEIVYFRGHISTALWKLADVPRKARPSFFERIHPLHDDEGKYKHAA